MDEIIAVPYYANEIDDIDFFSEKLNNNTRYKINHNPWDYDFNGNVNFSIAYNEEAIFVKFYVIEKNIMAIYTQPNDPVYKDSCVEFFIAIDGEESYYNFEFNCKGTCLAGFGNGKVNRSIIASDYIKSIKTKASFKKAYYREEEMIEWELTVRIPKNVFVFHNITSFKNKKAKVNFYKCGDDLPEPHFLCWNSIESIEPDFHLPQFFGNAIFIDN